MIVTCTHFFLNLQQLYIYIYIYIYQCVDNYSIEYKIIRVECSMPKQSDITSKHKFDLFHKNFIHNKFVSHGKREACHTRQVNVASPYETNL